MYKKRIISYAMILIVLISFMSILTGCATSEKIPIPTIKEDVYIYDQDNIINDDVEKKLNKMLVELEEKTEAEFAVISIESLLGQTIESYANNLFNTLGIGKKGKDNGVLLLFSRSDERVRLEIGRGLEGCLPDAKCGRILDDFFVPYRESDEYSKATEFTVSAVLKVLCEEYGVEINGLDTESIEIQESEEITLSDILLLLVLVTIVVAVLAVITSYSSTGHFGGGRFGGGGFSGGGFGGGFSGGGGASR